MFLDESQVKGEGAGTHTHTQKKTLLHTVLKLLLLKLGHAGNDQFLVSFLEGATHSDGWRRDVQCVRNSAGAV